MAFLLYLDPSTGSLAHQIVVGFILVVTTFWRQPWRKLSAVLRRNKRA